MGKRPRGVGSTGGAGGRGGPPLRGEHGHPGGGRSVGRNGGRWTGDGRPWVGGPCGTGRAACMPPLHADLSGMGDDGRAVLQFLVADGPCGTAADNATPDFLSEYLWDPPPSAGQPPVPAPFHFSVGGGLRAAPPIGRGQKSGGLTGPRTGEPSVSHFFVYSPSGAKVTSILALLVVTLSRLSEPGQGQSGGRLFLPLLV